MTGTLVQWTRKTMQNSIPKHNTLHWDRNSNFSLFLHNGFFFVFKINNRGGKLGQNFTAHLSRQVPGLEMHQKTQKFSSPRSLFFLKSQKTQKFSSPRSLYFPKTRKKSKNAAFFTSDKFKIQSRSIRCQFCYSQLLKASILFSNTIYCKKLKICMRPWIRKL